MDDSAQSLTPAYRQTPGDAVRTPVMQPEHIAPVIAPNATVTIQQPEAAAAQQPVQVSVSVGSKEQGAVIMPAAKEDQEDDEKPVVAAQEQVVTASVPEVVLPKEVAEHIEHGPDAQEHQLDETVKQAGVSLTNEATPVITEPTLPFSLPMNYQEATQLKKTAKIKDAVKWVAALVLYNLKKINPTAYKS